MEEYEVTKIFNDLLIDNDLPIIPLKINGKLKNVLGQILISKRVISTNNAIHE